MKRFPTFQARKDLILKGLRDYRERLDELYRIIESEKGTITQEDYYAGTSYTQSTEDIIMSHTAELLIMMMAQMGNKYRDEFGKLRAEEEQLIKDNPKKWEKILKAELKRIEKGR